MEFEVIAVEYGQSADASQDRHSKAKAAAHIARQLATTLVDEDEWEFRAYSAGMELTVEERNVARQLGLSEVTLRDSKTRNLLRGARGM